MKVVSNSTPLISLSAIGQLDLLKDYFGEIILPGAVFDEIVVFGKGLPGSKEVENAKWIKTLIVKDEIAVVSLKAYLDIGESEAIVLAKEIGADLILLDDKGSREAAKLQGLNVIGTIGILSKASRDGRIKDFKRSLDDLISAGFRLSEEDYKKIVSEKL